MRFQTKIIFGYMFFVFVAAVILGVFYYNFSINQYKQAEEKNLNIIAKQIVSQLDETIKPMELTMNYILSDPDILSAISALSEVSESSILDYDQLEAKTQIRTGLNIDFITSHFYRTIVFNMEGVAVTSVSMEDRRTVASIDYEGMQWLSSVDDAKGKPVIVNSHTDTWGYNKNPQVFSLIKALQGRNMGYIEVQRKVEDFAKIIQLPKAELNYMIYVNKDELLYSNMTSDSLEKYLTFTTMEGEIVGEYEIEEENKDVILAKSDSSNYHMTVLLMEDLAEVNKNTTYIAPITFLVMITFFAISMIFVMIISNFLTKPIRQLKTIMEKTELQDMGDKVLLSTSIDEIEGLKDSYQDVLGRLKESMVKEKRMSLLHLQAQFDTLQSQVNPHFLYNVLNLIAARGMLAKEEKICEMCGSLAAMLRYSTNTKNRYATVGEELTYLEQYFYLLKARFEHKIEFHIQVEEEIKSQIVPKMVLQQVVENCINHGFENSTEQMVVRISGYQECGKWFVKVSDNGQGFDENALKELELRLMELKKHILKAHHNIEAEIGGMGLTNMYARLLLLYNDELIFKLYNSEEGAEVIFGASVRKDDGNV